MKTTVAFSGGKDSTAMLLRLLEEGKQVDQIVFADTGFEFPELHDYIKRVETYIGREITVLKQPSISFKEFKDKQNVLIEKLESKGVEPCSPIYKEGWNEDSEVTKFEEWFYGLSTRGKSAGKQRGFPLLAFPCWWTRESKVKPLEQIQKDSDIVYVGIAFDEQKRISTKNPQIQYPLNDWEMTEKDCIDYLNKKNMFNPLYVNFDRLGCYHCPKQSEKSLYVLWKVFPKLWATMKWWDQETFRITGHYIKDKIPLNKFEADFEAGKEPKKLPKYECWNDFLVIRAKDCTQPICDNCATNNPDSYHINYRKALELRKIDNDIKNRMVLNDEL